MAEKERIQISSIVKQANNQLSTELDGEVVLMSVEKGNYYSMDTVGSRIWSLIEKPRSVASVVDILLEEFAIGRAACEEEVLDFLNNVAEEQLIILAEEPTA